MCVIIVNDRNKKNIPTFSQINKAVNYNPDGAGVTYKHKNKIYNKYFKDKEFTATFIYNFMRNVKDNYILHFRFATCGTEDNLQPIRIDDVRSFAHNGHVYELSSEEVSDSYVMADLLRNGLSAKDILIPFEAYNRFVIWNEVEDKFDFYGDWFEGKDNLLYSNKQLIK